MVRPDVGRQREPPLDQRQPFGEIIPHPGEEEIVRLRRPRMAVAPPRQQVAVENQAWLWRGGRQWLQIPCGWQTASRRKPGHANMVRDATIEVAHGQVGVLEGKSREFRVSALRKAVGAIADVLVPALCVACHGRLSTHDVLCPKCWSGIDFIRAPLCTICPRVS